MACPRARGACMPIRWETNEAVWSALLRIRSWLVGEFLDKWSRDAAFTREDSRPITGAWERLHAGEFELYEDFFRRSRSAICTLHERLADLGQTTRLELAARAAGNDAERKKHHEAAGRKFNELVAGYTADLHAIKGLLEVHLREQPRISMPSLRRVGGAIIIDSPHARSQRDDRSTHISRSILGGSPQSDEVQELLRELAEQVTALVRASRAGAGSAAVAAEVAGNCRTLTEELAKPKPRRKWWQLSLEGLKEAAQALGEVGVPIVQTAKKLAELLG